MRRLEPASLVAWLPKTANGRRLIGIFFVDAVGTGVFLAGSALFFTRFLRLTPAEVGIGLSLAGVVGFFCSVPLGRLSDRIGSHRTLVLLYVWRGAGFVAYAFTDGWVSFLLTACFLGAAEWAVGPVIQTLIGSVEGPESRVRSMASVNVMRNAGFTIGALLSTVVATVGDDRAYIALVLANACSFLAAAMLLLRLRPTAAPLPVAFPAESVTARQPLRDLRYLLLAAVNGVLFLHTVILALALPLWILTSTTAPAFIVGVLMMLNTTLALTIGVRLSRGVTGVEAGARRHQWSGLSLAACCLLLALTASADRNLSILLLVGASVVLTFGEIWQSTGGWALSYALSPSERRTYYVSVYNLGEPLAATAGPALLTVAVNGQGASGWLGLAVTFIVASAVVRVVARHTRPAPVSVPTGGAS